MDKYHWLEQKNLEYWQLGSITRLARCAIFCFLAIYPTFAAYADNEQTAPGKSFSIYFENDVFSTTDQHYTNGARLTYMYSRDYIPAWGKRFASWANMCKEKENCFSPQFGLSLGQNMYTPGDIKTTQLIPNDRPYAGWLYAGFFVNLVKDSRLHYFELDIGIVGPSSLAEKTQKTIHNWINVTEPMGWDNQLKDEPAINFLYQYKTQSCDVFGMNQLRYFNCINHAGFSWGNVITQANLGTTLRFGYNIPDDFGPDKINMKSMESSQSKGVTKNIVEFYLFASVDGRIVCHNIFLDGNTFRDSHSVNKKNLVGDFDLGFVFRCNKHKITYRFTTRTREFEGQEKMHKFGSMVYTYEIRGKNHD